MSIFELASRRVAKRNNEQPEYIIPIGVIRHVPLENVDQILYSNYHKALSEYEDAQHRFQHAAVGYEEVATLELAAAEARYKAILNEMRQHMVKPNQVN